MFPSIGAYEMLVIGVIALLVVGPRRLPEILKGIAYVYKSFTKAIDELKRELEEDLEEVDDLNPKKSIQKKWEEFLEIDEEKKDKKRSE